MRELTDGRVQFKYYGARELGRRKEVLRLTSRGITDIGFVVPAYNRGSMPLTSVHTLPGLSSSPLIAHEPFWTTLHTTRTIP